MILHARVPTCRRDTLRGEFFDAARHPVNAEIKAVTYQQVAVERRGTCWRPRVTFDN